MDPKLLEVLTQMMEFLEAITLIEETRADPYSLRPRMNRLRDALTELEKPS